MLLKEIIEKALRNIIQKQTMMNLSSRFLFVKILKNVKEQNSIYSLADLKTIKYIKEKSFKIIADEANKVAIKENLGDLNSYQAVNPIFVNSVMPVDSDSDQFLDQLKNKYLKNDLKTFSSDLSDLDQPIIMRHKEVNEVINSRLQFNSEDFNNNSKLTCSNQVKKLQFNSEHFKNNSKLTCPNQVKRLQFNSEDFNSNLEFDSYLPVLSHVNKNNSDHFGFDHFLQDRPEFNSKLLDHPVFDSFIEKDDSSSSDLIILSALNNKSLDNVISQANKKNIKQGDRMIISHYDTNKTHSPINKILSSIEEQVFSSFSDLTLDNFVKKDNSIADQTNGTFLFSSSVMDNKIKRSKYVPGYRTAAYAILKALYQHNGSHKHLVVLRATPFTDAEFDRSKKFSAFSSFKTLEKKDLIICNSESKYFLTDSGMELAKSLFFNEPKAVESQNNEIKLIVDSREKKSNSDRNYFQAHFTNKNILNETRFLALGDFIWIKNEKLIEFIVERKQSTDFVSSISDGRYKEQKKRLISLGLNVFYLVENLKVEESRKKFIHRCLLEIRTQGFILLETENIQESGFVLEEIDKMIRENRYEKTSNLIGYGSFLEESNKNRLVANDMLLISLLSIKGLSKELALGLAQNYKTLHNFRLKIKENGYKAEFLKFKHEGKELSGKIAKRIIDLMM